MYGGCLGDSLGDHLFPNRGSGSGLREKVAGSWGSEQEATPPVAEYYRTETHKVTKKLDDKDIQELVQEKVAYGLPLESNHLTAGIDLDYRQKGLMWYSTYKVAFSGDYVFRNTSDQDETVTFRLHLPATHSIYDGLQFTVNGSRIPTVNVGESVQGSSVLEKGAVARLGVVYRSQGLGNWTYSFGEGVAQVRDFSLKMHTNFEDIDFSDNALSPTSKQRAGDGWDLGWDYKDLVSGYHIAMVLPEKLQPGPLAGAISLFAPVSLFFFFFVMLMVTSIRKIDLHPMNYFFLAGAFFSFHLLLAYLVDHISIHWAVAICSLVSVFLVVSYLRLVAGSALRGTGGGGRADGLPGVVLLCVFLQRIHGPHDYHWRDRHSVCGDAVDGAHQVVGTELRSAAAIRRACYFEFLKKFFGNPHIALALDQMIERKRIPQTLLFSGPEGVGKATLARIFAARLLGVDADKMQQDDLSLEANQTLITDREKWTSDKRNEDPLVFSSHPDFLTFAPDGPLRQITIQQMRLLKERASFKPLKGDWRVFLIDSIDRANEQAANSLLKTLEEPPSHLILILTARNAYDLLPTIRSRTVPFHFSRLGGRRNEDISGRASGDWISPTCAVDWRRARPGVAVSLDLEAYARRRTAMLALLKVASGAESFGSWMKHSDSIGMRRTEKFESYLEVLYGLIEDVVRLANGHARIRNEDVRNDLEGLARRYLSTGCAPRWRRWMNWWSSAGVTSRNPSHWMHLRYNCEKGS